MRLVAASINIYAEPGKILQAFLKQDQLKSWWGVSRSLIQAKPGGLYTLAWDINEQGIRYVSSGIISELISYEYLMIKNFVYLNAEKEILGPMELEVDLNVINNETTKVGIVQSGYQYGGDWDWYYNSVVLAWPQTLELLKNFLEK